MPAERGPRSAEFTDDPAPTGPLTVPDLLAKSGHPSALTSARSSGRGSGRGSGHRVAARQAVVEVRRHRVRRSLAALLTILVALLASTAAYYVGLFFYLDRTVERVDALAVDSPGIMSPQAQDAADNFLIVGTGTDGSEISVRSALIAHLTPDRDAAVLVSLPLTAFLDVPACPVGAESGLADPYGGSLASSYQTGGPGCLVRSVQQLSGMRMDHYIQLDIERLPGMVDALGGVPVCLPAEMSTDAEPPTPAASSVLLDADQVRAVLGDVDPEQDPNGQLTTDRQRLLLASTLREALRLENLLNPIVLTRFIGQVASGLTLDPDTTLGELKDLGDKLGEFTAGDTVLASVPLSQVAYQPVGSEQSYALIDDAASRGLFQAIISDSDLPDPVGATPADGGAAEPSTPPEPVPTSETVPAPAPDVLTVAPEQVSVNVYNGIGTPGLASDAAAQLAAQGFGIGEVENQISGDTQSVVRYSADQLQAARTVAASVPNSVLQEGSTVGGFIDLVIGSSFIGVVAVVISPPAPATPAVTTTGTPTMEPTAEPTGAAARQSCD